MHRLLVATVMVILATAGSVGAQSTPPTKSPTYNTDVAPIIYKHCASCHRPGEIAPMSLLTFKDTRPWVKAIGARVSQGTMPPWHADPAYGEFMNDRRLSANEKDTILRWVNAGGPEGNPADLPVAPKFVQGWSIGEPDAVLTMQEDYPLPASGVIPYEYFEVPTNFTEDRWIQAFEVRPGSRANVHHVIVYARPPASPRHDPRRVARRLTNGPAPSSRASRASASSSRIWALSKTRVSYDPPKNAARSSSTRRRSRSVSRSASGTR